MRQAKWNDANFHCHIAWNKNTCIKSPKWHTTTRLLAQPLIVVRNSIYGWCVACFGFTVCLCDKINAPHVLELFENSYLVLVGCTKNSLTHFIESVLVRIDFLRQMKEKRNKNLQDVANAWFMEHDLIHNCDILPWIQTCKQTNKMLVLLWKNKPFLFIIFSFLFIQFDLRCCCVLSIYALINPFTIANPQSVGRSLAYVMLMKAISVNMLKEGM